MRVIKIYNETNKPSAQEKEQIIDFLFEHLQEFGDPKEDIAKAAAYALREKSSFGGFILTSEDDNGIVGCTIVNQTGMCDYIPENILVYIATHKDCRGKGIGKELLKKAIDIAGGDVALHVEPNNPAKFLYEKVGFVNKYLEMRYKK